MIMKKMSILLVLIVSFFFTSANNRIIKKNTVRPAKTTVQKANARTVKQSAIEKKNAPVKLEYKKTSFDCNGSATFYCGGEIITVFVSIIGPTQQGDCINFARAVSEFLQENYCGAASY